MNILKLFNRRKDQTYQLIFSLLIIFIIYAFLLWRIWLNYYGQYNELFLWVLIVAFIPIEFLFLFLSCKFNVRYVKVMQITKCIIYQILYLYILIYWAKLNQETAPLILQCIEFIIVLIGISMIIYIPIKNIKSLQKINTLQRKIKNSSYKSIKFLTLLLVMVIFNIASNYFVNNIYLILAMCVFVFISFYYLLYINYWWEFKNVGEFITVQFLNLDMKDISDNKVYINNSTGDYDAYRIFEFDFSRIFPDNSLSKQIKVLNHPFIPCEKSTVTYNEKTKCYIAINPRNQLLLTKLEIFLSYQINNKTVKKRLNLYIESINIAGELIITNKYVECYRYVLLSKWYKEYASWKPNEFDIKKTYQFSYQYQEILDITSDNILNKTINDTRKWVHHEGEYGEGKTSLDLLTVSNSGLNPVVISPWAENYDQDLLGLIFKKVSERSKVLFHFPDKMTSFFYLVEMGVLIPTFTAIITWLIKFISEFGKQTKLFDLTVLESFNNTLPQAFLLGCIVIASIVSALVAAYFLPQIILKLKDSTKLYQSFYIKEIKKMLLKEKIVLIIEDIDRLNGEALDNMFRTISSINENCFGIKRIIGIISYSTSNIAKLVKNGKHNDVLKDIENKLIYTDIFKGYSNKESMKVYLQKSFSSLLYLHNLNIEGCPKTKTALEKINFNMHNFRTIHKFLDEISTLDYIDDEILSIKIKDNFSLYMFKRN